MLPLRPGRLPDSSHSAFTPHSDSCHRLPSVLSALREVDDICLQGGDVLLEDLYFKTLKLCSTSVSAEAPIIPKDTD